MNKTSYILLIGILLITLQSCKNNQNTGETILNDYLSGYWYGDFAPDNSMNLVFYFWQEDSVLTGSMFVVKGDSIEDHSTFKNIYIEGNSINFSISSYDLLFAGEINQNDNLLNGNASSIKINLSKVEEKQIAAYQKIQSICNPIKFDKKIEVDELKDDLLFLKKQLEENHPQLYTFLDKDKFDNIFDNALNEIDKEMTTIEFMRIIKPLVTQIKCGHTEMIYSENFMNAIKENGKSMPLKVKIIENKAYVIDNLSDNQDISVGDEILSINSMSVNEIIKELKTYFSSDAFNESHKVYKINLNFSFAYNYIESPEDFNLQVKKSDNSTIQTSLKTKKNNLLFDEIYSNSTPEFPFKFKMVNDKIAFFKIYSFMYSDLEKYKAFIDSSFNQIKSNSITKLIIDLRGNFGGDPYYSSYLLRYVINKPFVYFSENAENYPELSTELKPNENIFTGNVKFLTDGACFSTTGHFISLIKYYKIGEIIGEEPGGSFSCNDNSKLFTLPNSHLKVNIARKTFQTDVEGMQIGYQIKPDYEVIPNIQDVLEEKDVQLEYAIKRF